MRREKIIRRLLVPSYYQWVEKDGKVFLKEIGIKKGQTILDFGCCEGHYTIPAAKVVGKEGKVYAIDKDGNVLNGLIKGAKKENLKNIKIIKTKVEGMNVNGKISSQPVGKATFQGAKNRAFETNFQKI